MDGKNCITKCVLICNPHQEGCDGGGTWHLWGARRDVYKVLEKKPERPHGRLRPKWEDTIKRNLEEMGWEEADWIDMAQAREKWRALVTAV
jgi:hypothetical protein